MCNLKWVCSVRDVSSQKTGDAVLWQIWMSFDLAAPWPHGCVRLDVSVAGAEIIALQGNIWKDKRKIFSHGFHLSQGNAFRKHITTFTWIRWHRPCDNGWTDRFQGSCARGRESTAVSSVVIVTIITLIMLSSSSSPSFHTQGSRGLVTFEKTLLSSHCREVIVSQYANRLSYSRPLSTYF